MFRLAAWMTGIFAAITVWAETPAPATVEFMFDPDASGGVKTVSNGDTSFLRGIRYTGGVIQNKWWRVEPTLAFGQGSLEIEIDRDQLAGDLALVLRADWQKDTNIAVQLYDGQGRALALDLFGEMSTNARNIGTDTFVVPLEKYKDATSIVVRRLSGDFRLVGGGLYPVLSEVTSTAENEKELAQKLGVIISPHHWMFNPAGRGEEKSISDTGIGSVHALLPLEKTNSVGAAALRQGRYPAYRPLTSGTLAPLKIAASNTTEGIIGNAIRMITLRTGGTPPKVMHTSSDGVAEMLLQESYNLVFLSVPLSSAEKEEFFRQHGYPPVELAFARDALMILVNASNPVKSITVPQLDAIYGKELRAGAKAPITDWSQLGGGSKWIKAFRGWLNWGTTRTFQQLVLKGGAFRDGLPEEDVVYASGIEKEVANADNAIGFATLRLRSAKVRAVAVAPNSGEAASLPDAEGIYSGKYPMQRKFYAYSSARTLDGSGDFQRELVNLMLSDVGQTLVARTGTLPLTADEVIEARAQLRLP